MITRALLRSLRNDLPMPFTIRQLGDKAPYHRSCDGNSGILGNGLRNFTRTLLQMSQQFGKQPVFSVRLRTAAIR